jgi:hypothetical protein
MISCISLNDNGFLLLKLVITIPFIINDIFSDNVFIKMGSLIFGITLALCVLLLDATETWRPPILHKSSERETKQPLLNSMNFRRKTLFDFKVIFFSIKSPWWDSFNVNWYYSSKIRYLNHLI